MATYSFRGLIAPVLTPFNDDKSLNLDIIPKYAEFLVKSGIKGVLVNGTSGEGMSMTVSERKLVTEAWVKICKETKQHLMVQVGGAPLPDVLELATHAEGLKVDSLLCLPELYSKPANSDDLIRYLKIVGEAAPTTPLLYYHIPNWTGVNIHMGQFLKAVTGKIPTFNGIKFTSTLLDEGIAAVNANKQYTVFLGADTVMLGAYALGFDSSIATTLNLLPSLGIRILNLVQEAKISEAKDAQDELSTAVAAITKNGAWVPTMKEAMNLLTPINAGPVREPLLALTKNQVEEMKVDLKKLKLLH